VNIPRVGVVLLGMFAIALTAVHLRVEQTRSAARTLRIESEWIDLRRQRWALQTRAARLRAPDLLRNRVETWQAGLIPPEADKDALTPMRLASDRLFE